MLQSAEARQWLIPHAIDPAAVAAADLARVVPGCLDLPRWARRGGQTGFDRGHRLDVRLWQPAAAGAFEHVSLHSRRLAPEASQDKARFPRGCSAARLMLACGPQPFVDCDGPQPDGPRCLTIVAVGSGFLRWATRPAAARYGLLGSVPAAVAPWLFGRLPARCRVVLRHHLTGGGQATCIGWDCGGAIECAGEPKRTQLVARSGRGTSARAWRTPKKPSSGQSPESFAEPPAWLVTRWLMYAAVRWIGFRVELLPPSASRADQLEQTRYFAVDRGR